MIPILYDGDEILFTSNGLGRLPDCIACEVTEERNGIYECMFQYPVTGRLYDEIKIGRIIAVTHDNNHDIQPFDIYSVSAPLNGVVTFYARHISYRLSNIILKPFTASSCADALSKMESRTYNENPFTFWTNKNVDGIWKNEVPASCKALLVGQSGSILDIYGKGEYEFDVFTVKLYVNRGIDTGISIRYGVNLTDLTKEIDNGNLYTAVAPFWKSADGETVVTLPEGFIVADNVPTTLYPWTTNTGEYVRDNNGNIIYFNVPTIKPVPLDLSGEFSEEPMVSQLRSLAKAKLNSSDAWLPTENITISFVDQASTFDYQDIAKLQPVTLCDKINVYCGPLNVSAAKIEVVKLVYDVLTEQNKAIELGTIRKTYMETLMEQIANNYVSKSDADNIVSSSINKATKIITGATDSHVRFVYDDEGGLQEIVIMDTEDIETAHKIWRWNSGGLGYSSNGYGGPYNLAMTQDGEIVADFITTGTISDAEGNNYWNLLTGFLNTQSGQIGSFTIDNGALVYNGASNTASISDDGIEFSTISNNDKYIARIDGNGLTVAQENTNKRWVYTTYESNAAGLCSAIRYYDDNTTLFNYWLAFIPRDVDPRGYIAVEYDMIFGPNADIYTWANLYFYHYHYGDSNRSYDANILSDYSSSAQEYALYVLVHNKSSATFASTKVYLWQDTICNKSLTVNGTKSRVVDTKDYGERALYCYETPTPMFGDIGEGVISETGDCYIWFDSVFAKTIESKGYQVFLQPYGRGELFVKDRCGAYFVVEGTPGLAFGWEVKAKQTDYDQLRLERTDIRKEPGNADYAKMADDHLKQINEMRGIDNGND